MPDTSSFTGIAGGSRPFVYPIFSSVVDGELYLGAYFPNYTLCPIPQCIAVGSRRLAAEVRLHLVGQTRFNWYTKAVRDTVQA